MVVSASTPSELSWLWREAPTQAAGSPGAPSGTHRGNTDSPSLLALLIYFLFSP